MKRLTRTARDRLVWLWLVVVAVMAWQVMAAAAQEVFVTKAEEAILIDVRTGRVMFEKDADTPVPPASMSKLMTMIMVFEGLKSGKLSLDQDILISEDAWRRGGASSGGSTMYAELNSRVKLGDIIQGIIVQSANDGCIAVAEAMAGSETLFAERMTARAHELGATSATFKNATGLPDPEHRMSVRDLATLARYIITEFPQYYTYYSQPEFTWNKIRQLNRNPLLKDYPGADGMKTGYTREAGYGLVGSAVRDRRRLLMVATGFKSIKDRKEESQKLLDWGFRQFRSVDLYDKGDKVGWARVWGGTRRSVELQLSDDMRVSLSAQEQAIAEVKLAYKGPIMAPVEAGTRVGSVRFLVDGLTVADVPVETAQAVGSEPSMWSRALDSLFIMAFGR
jgi:D-alanyl-D-alanine carboxypeptidase (penicillin-binding protein 5/6)